MTDLSTIELSELQKHLSNFFELSIEELDLFIKTVKQLQPWEANLMSKLLHDRGEDRRARKAAEQMASYVSNLGAEVFETDNLTYSELPLSYEVIQDDSSNPFILQRDLSGEIVELGRYSAMKDAVATARAWDKLESPYRWRPIEELCPDNAMLLFCSVTFPALQPPIKTGYREKQSYRIFGGSWCPTHWCYLPEAPVTPT